ncbi:MAG: BON domain-containing protein [Acidiferrobacterales bacterium]
MTDDKTILREIHAALEQEPRVRTHHGAIHVAISDGALTVEGEVESIAVKRVALQQARAINGTHRTIDRLRIAQGEHRGDGAVRDALSRFLLTEGVFLDYAIRARSKGELIVLRDPGGQAQGPITLEVREGVVTLSGNVGSLSHRRLAGVLAWWTPGCRDVVNELEVTPLESDHDDEILDALRLVLEKDPLVHADQIRADSHDGIVTLHGFLGTAEERKMAELDAWYLLGVQDVVNRIEIRQ